MRFKRWYEKNYKRFNLKNMKKILLLLLCLLFFSCNSDKKEESIIEETGEIIEWYFDTLEWSVKDAKDVKALYKKRNEKYIKE